MLPPLPRVTVGIPVYRGEKHILEAVASVRADKFTDWEMVVFIDCSPDSSAELVGKIQDRRIRVLSSRTNLGLVNARNQILDEARGQFVAWLDQDDLNYPFRLAKQVQFLDAHPEVSLIASWTDVQVESEDGSIDTFTHIRPSTHAGIRAAMSFTNPIACNTVMMRKKHFRDRGFAFRQEFGNTLDYDLWSRASDDLTFHVLRQSLGVYRVHSAQTSRGAELERMHQQALEVQSEFLIRNINIFMYREERELHAKVTRAPMQAIGGSALEPVKAWFAKLRAANAVREQVDVAAFDRVIAQEWFRVVNSSNEMTMREKFWRGTTGAREIGVSWSRISAALRSALVRRRMRR